MDPSYLKRVYCIIVTYNGIRWIDKCITSLIASSYPHKIIVIDNGSSDNTVATIKRSYPDVHLVETPKNLGFGQANNIGLRMALKENADYVFLLNQDAWVDSSTIQLLVEVHQQNPALGILSPLHANGAGTSLDEYFSNYLAASKIGDFLRTALLDRRSFDQIIETSFVNAAAWLVSMECVKKTGGFDPIFFHYGEDDNYCQRVLFRGFKIAISPLARIYHDREQRISGSVDDLNARTKKEWIHLLNQACNIRNPGYKKLMTMRFLRTACAMTGSLFSFRKAEFLYYYLMAKKIIIFIPRIKKSRSESLSNSPSPHL